MAHAPAGCWLLRLASCVSPPLRVIQTWLVRCGYPPLPPPSLHYSMVHSCSTQTSTLLDACHASLTLAETSETVSIVTSVGLAVVTATPLGVPPFSAKQAFLVTHK